jgi:hypothetical protein
MPGKPPPPPEGYRPFMVAVVCTGRRSHPENTIAKLGEFVDGDGTVRVLYQKAGRRPDPLAGWQEPDGSRTFRFECRRCPTPRGGHRDVRLHESRVLEAMEAMRGSGAAVPVIDVSVVC